MEAVMAEHAFERFRRLRGLAVQEQAPKSVTHEVVPHHDIAQEGTGKTDTTSQEAGSAPAGAGSGTVTPDVTLATPSLGQRCPNPACLDIVEQANAYVLRKLAGRLAPNYTPLFTSQAYQGLRGQLAEALLAGDLDATKAHCRQWCQVVIAWTTDHERRAQEYAAAIDGVVA
jgi:hypothetical protein